jgi:ubiquinone/menaquinone biosynthesis C-methylase UbiE
MRSQRYYDNTNNRLVYISQPANAKYWDNHWQTQGAAEKYLSEIPYKNYVVQTTLRYVKKGGVILEGGCGKATFSHYFSKLGYQPIALDFAENTIAALQERVPYVNPMLGDVHNLALPANSVDAYWSLGVIEHFYEGYEKIIHEAYRVIKPGGYLLLTCPTMSIWRTLRAKRNFYPPWQIHEKELQDQFYQFALDKLRVKQDLEQNGFKVHKIQKVNGTKGFKEDSPKIEKIIDALIAKNKSAINLGMTLLEELFLVSIFNHVALYICQKG